MKKIEIYDDVAKVIEYLSENEDTAQSDILETLLEESETYKKTVKKIYEIAITERVMKAFENLCSAWQELEDEMDAVSLHDADYKEWILDKFAEAYPFEKSFDEYDVSGWCYDMKFGLEAKLEELKKN